MGCAGSRRATLAMGLWLLLAPSAALAQTSAQDVQVAARALSFLQTPLTGEVTVGIVYIRNNPQSADEAQTLQRLLGSGLIVGNITLQSVLVPLDEAAKANVRLFLLVPGVGAQAQSLADISRTRHLPCVTTDLAQVRAGRCAAGVRSKPTIEILVNRAAAAASGMAFSTVFRMMVTEI